MWTNSGEMLRETHGTLDAALPLTYYTTPVQSQQAAVGHLDRLNERIERYRKTAIVRKDEPAANLAWVLEAFTDGIRSFLLMWVHLKDNKFQSAWNALITAEDCIATGLRHRFTDGLFELNRRLHGLESALFPPCRFTSPSITFERSDCSICQREYGECGHLAGNLYMGEMCRQVVRDIIDADHIAIVDSPADKRQRIPQLPDGPEPPRTAKERAEIRRMARKRLKKARKNS